MSTQNLSELEQNMEEDCQEWLESLDYISQAYGHAVFGHPKRTWAWSLISAEVVSQSASS